MVHKFFTSRIVLPMLVAVFVYTGSLAASDLKTVRGYVESADGKRLKHVSVRITAVGGTTTTDSGEFALDLPSSFGAGDAVLFSVNDWVIMQPYVNVRGRMYLPRSETELVELVVARKGDERLLQKDQIAQIVQAFLLKNSRTKNSIEMGPEGSQNDSDEFFRQIAEELGFSVHQVKDAITLWATTVEEPYQKGLAALYEQKYPQAIDLITKSIQPLEKDLVQKYIYLWVAYLDNGELASAEEVIRKAKAIRASDSDVLLDLGTVLNAEEKYSEAIVVLQEAKDALLKEYGRRSPHLATNLNNLAYAYNALGRYADAELLYKEALEIDTEIYGSDDPEVAMDVGNIGFLYLQTGREKDAESWLIRAKDIDVKRYGPEDPRAARDFTNLGVFYDSQGQLQKALEYFQFALATDKHRQNANHPSIAIHLSNLGQLYDRLGKTVEAETMLNQACNIDKIAFGPDHPEVAVDLSNLGKFYLKHQRYPEAAEVFTQALKIDEAWLPSSPVRKATALTGLATTYARQHKYAQAKKCATEAATLLETTSGKNTIDYVPVLYVEAEIEREQGNYETAEPLYKSAISILEQKSPSDPDFVVVCSNLGLMYSQSGKLVDAERYYRKAFEFCSHLFGEQSEPCTKVRRGLDNVLRRLGKQPDD